MVGYNKLDHMTANQKLFAGCCSGVITRFITQPLDVVKIRTQLQKRKVVPNAKRKYFRVTKKIFKEEGLKAFWHGHNLGQLHSIIGVSTQFFVYEMTTKYVHDTQFDASTKKILVFLSGIFAGCCSATLVVPLEVIRVRQMVVQQQYKGAWNGAKEVYSSGGILAFYEGLTASLLQMGPQVGISFCVFSTLQPIILKYLAEVKGATADYSHGNKYGPEILVMASAMAGSASGFFSKSMTYPFDLAKRRLQIGSHKVDEKYKVPSTSRNLIKCKRLMDCIYKTIQSEGFLGLYQGWKVTVYKAQITSVIAFTSYELLCYAIRELTDT